MNTGVERKSETEEKTRRLCEMLARNSLAGVLISSQHNFAWLSGGATNGVDTTREAGAASVLVRNDGTRFILANRIEMHRLLAEEISESLFEPVEFGWEEEKSSASLVKTKATSLLRENGKLASDLPLDPNCPIIENDIASCRYELTESEILRFRELGKDAARTLSRVIRSVVPGMTETEVARIASDELAKQGIRSVVLLVGSDKRLKRYRHPLPSDQRWKETLMLVVCARRFGLTASLTRIVSSVEIDNDLRRRTDAAARVNARLLSSTIPRKTGAELYREAAAAYEAEGFVGEEHLHHQGGACGYRTRDWLAHSTSNERVHLNQAFAWNPSITGTKVEETCIVLSDGIEPITATPDWPQIEVAIDGRVYCSPDVVRI
jgi:Xaa-Pro aminopeptidase